MGIEHDSFPETLVERIKKRISRVESVHHHVVSGAVSVASGSIAFWACLGVSTTLQKSLLAISTGSRLGVVRPVPSFLGFASVCWASLMSHKASLAVVKYTRHGELPEISFIQKHQRHRTRSQSASFSNHEEHFNRVPLSSIFICLLGIVSFKAFRGRFWAISPSSYTHLGSFARASLPATARYANASQRLGVEALGAKYGCHTCGSKARNVIGSYRFVGDHQPPKSVARQLDHRFLRRLFNRKVQFRFFPQCQSCSRTQGNLLGKAQRDRVAGTRVNLRASGGGRESYNHALHPRWNHLAGGIVGGTAVWGANEDDLVDENRYRYTRYIMEVRDRLECILGYLSY